MRLEWMANGDVALHGERSYGEHRGVGRGLGCHASENAEHLAKHVVVSEIDQKLLKVMSTLFVVSTPKAGHATDCCAGTRNECGMEHGSDTV